MKKLFFFLFFFIIAVQILSAQWIETKGPYGGTVNCLLHNSNYIYSGTSNGVYVTTDDGLNWKNTGLHGLQVSSFTTVLTNILAGTNSGVYISANQGETWVTAGLADIKINTLVASGSKLFAGTDNGMYISSDYGANWNAAVGFTNYIIYVLAADEQKVYAGTGSGIFTSTNGGITWENIGPENYQVRAFAVNGANIVAGTNMQGVFRSSDSGETWELVNGFEGSSVSSITAAGGNFYLSDLSLYVSTDAGITWQSLGLRCYGVRAVLINNSGIYTGTGASGIYFSNDNGTHWKALNNGLMNIPVLDFTSSKKNIFAAAGGGGIVTYNEENNCWDNLDIPPLPFYCCKVINDNIYAPSGWGIYRSTDEGNSWQRINQTGFFVVFRMLDIAANSGVFCLPVQSEGIYRSTDGGYNWEKTVSFRYINSLAVRDDKFFAASSGDGIYISTDDGINWSLVNNGLNNLLVISLYSVGQNIFAGTGAGVYVSTNSGTEWKNAGLSNHSVSSFAEKDHILFAGTDNGIFYSEDMGATWQSAGLAEYSIKKIAVKDDYVFASNYEHVWRCSVLGLLSVEDNVEKPACFTLNQNYPNPFNPATKISYSLAERGNVKLIVYNTLGQEVKTLVNGEETAGEHTVEFNASSLPSGVYFYKIVTVSYTATKKMLLVK